ncbi:hypothetical protein [Sinorhizobium medicae]|nr:hypothetical protein [Sinorhizobium medicae]WQO88221.1 hypothetical protein U8C37_26445 [Sinorhizobium medicae]
MKKLLFSAAIVASLATSGGTARADVLIGVAGPVTGPNGAFGAIDIERD